MIKHLKYHQIDFKKYDVCIEKSYNSRIYALSWYLDIVTNKDWEVLVLDDYEAVMPLPFKRVKRQFLKRMITQPSFCQQLGVFSLSELDSVDFNLFITSFLKCKIYSYHFNAVHTDKLIDLEKQCKRVNFELKLDKSYTEIANGYSKNLKRNIKKGIKSDLKITNNVTIDDFILMKDSTKKHPIKKKHYKIMRNLLKEVQVKKRGSFYAVKNENEFVAIAFFTQTANRWIHLFSTSTLKGKGIGAIPLLFDAVIQENATKNVIFDFEGSMIDGVAQFFKSFGAINVPYIVCTFDKTV